MAPLPQGLSAGSVKDALRDIHHDILEATATGRGLGETMDLLCRRVEALDLGVIASVLGVDRDGRLRPLSAPSLPAHYSRAIDGVPVGPVAGSCGTAAYRGEPVIVTDIATDPLWADFRALALPIGLRACWSSPIRSSDNRVIGTFAFYRRSPGGPSEIEQAAVATCTSLCAIALENEEAKARIRELAFFDRTTRLPNRQHFHDLMADVLGAALPAEALALHLVDLDDFKGVNDTLGHHVGDGLLRAVAARLAPMIGKDDVLARVGCDEFAVLQRGASAPGDVRGMAERLLNAFAQPFEIEAHSLVATASIGIALSSGERRDLESLGKEADLALNRAKVDGGDTYRLFDPEMLDFLVARRTIEQDLRAADIEREFEILYQPIVCLRTKRIRAAEALLRWRHPQKGLISPATFIPVAERCGLMQKLGERVIETACRDAARWPPEIRVAVNLSPVQLKRPGFALDVLRTLEATGLSPRRLTFEITETALLGDANAAHAILGQFSAAGIEIALDDFGTGYSSLSHLRAFPIDLVKIDKSFVAEYGLVRDATAIVRAVLRLARDLGMRTIAEGIESADQLERLERSGCAMAQGFFLGRPQPRAVFEKLVGPAAASVA